MFLSKRTITLFTTSMISLAFASGCVSDGGSAAAIAEFDLIAGFHAESAQVKNGNYIAENNDEIALDKLKLHLSEIRLVSKSTAGGNGQTFDPANPPEPYENCHANHCHIKGSSDTISYADIEAMLSGGTVRSEDILVLAPNKDIEITSLTTPIELEDVASGDLPYGEINEVHVVFDTIALNGTNVTKQKTIALKNEHQHEDHVHVEPLELSHAVDIDIVAGSEEDQDLHLVVEIDADIFNEITGDDIDFADLMAEYTTLEIEGHDHDHEDHEHE